MIPSGGNMSSFPDHSFGMMLQPRNFGIFGGVKEGRKWAMDNDCFGGTFHEERFFNRVKQLAPYTQNCLFIVMPDKVGDAKTTLELYSKWHDAFRATGLPIAFVAQDGQEKYQLPNDYDVLFIGGSTEWKLSEHAELLCRNAHLAGKRVHVGRVNSLKRIERAYSMGADSVDGTCICFARDLYEKRLPNWMNQVNTQRIFAF